MVYIKRFQKSFNEKICKLNPALIASFLLKDDKF